MITCPLIRLINMMIHAASLGELPGCFLYKGHKQLSTMISTAQFVLAAYKNLIKMSFFFCHVILQSKKCLHCSVVTFANDSFKINESFE